MSKYYCKQLNNDEDMVLLGYGTAQEAQISLRYGANLCRYTYRGFNIIDYDPAQLKANDFTGTPVLYPTPNRVENGVFVFRGKSYEQVKRGRRIFEHGLVHDEKWGLVDIHATEKEALLSARITWAIDSPLFEAFPFPHSLTLTFRLIDGAIDITYDIFNYGSEEIPYGFGLHPYFQKLSGEENTVIILPVEHVMEATEALLPTGKILPVPGTTFDLNRPTSIGKLDLDHVFLRAAGDTPAAIHYTEQGFAINIHATDDFSHFVVYSPAGMPYFCIETQTCSTNAHNLYHRGLHEISGLVMVAPGEHNTGRVRYTISSEDA
jgi:aldose 1-epimerase